MQYDREALLDRIKTDALQFGEFTLASGQKSTYYIDCRKVTLSSVGAALIAAGMLEQLGDEPFEAVGGMSLGADPIVGAMLALAGMQGRELRGFLVRKEPKTHGTSKLVEGPLFPGDRVVIVEDVATTGGSALKAIEAVEKEDCEVIRVMVALDRLAGAAEAFTNRGYEFTSLFTIRDLGL